jgi:hypothetical protein
MISHANIMGLTESFTRAVPFRPDDELLSYLPLAHIYENLLSVFQAIYSGGTVNFVESMDTLAQNLREVSPTIFASVPRIWEKFMSMIEIRMSDSTVAKRALYRLAVTVGLNYVRSAKIPPRGFGGAWPIGLCTLGCSTTSNGSWDSNGCATGFAVPRRPHRSFLNFTMPWACPCGKATAKRNPPG